MTAAEKRQRVYGGRDMAAKETIVSFIEKRREMLCAVSDSIWDYAETKYEETRSAGLLCNILAEEGFSIKRGLAGMETAFTASYGGGYPVIAFLGEYDAQSGMSQKAGVPEPSPLIPGGNGHACGHHAIGAGALAAVLALKHYIEKTGAAGTLRYIGCPAAENGAGKAFLTRSACFDGVDAVITWHPFNSSNVMTFNVLATVNACFKFHGVSSHAAGSPHLGRSALDGVELMNVGANFLREHIESDARLHYAITDAGGLSPNVVQAEASVLYQIRAPRLTQARDIYARICDIAKGAALMSGTRVEVEFGMASSNMLLNHVLGRLVHQKFTELGPVPVDEADIALARKLREGMSEKEKSFDKFAVAVLFGEMGRAMAEKTAGKDIVDDIFPYTSADIVGMGSNDLGDVSWNAPTVCIHAVSFAKDTQPHSWRTTAQGKSALCHKGMLHAGKVMALTGAELLENPGLLEEAWKELDQRRSGENYICPIPPEVKPASLR